MAKVLIIEFKSTLPCYTAFLTLQIIRICRVSLIKVPDRTYSGRTHGKEQVVGRE